MPSQTNPSAKPDVESRISMNVRKESSGADWDDTEIFLRGVFDEDPKKGCELLFKRYYQPLCSYAVRFVYSKEIAQDLVGDLFYVFWQQQLHLRIESSFRAYLFIAVRNRALKHIKKEFLRPDEKADLTDLDQPSMEPNAQLAMQFHELSARIESGIRSLTPQCQKVFLLSRFESKKYSEIATELNLSLKTVEAHMSKALGVLRKIVRDEVFVTLLILFFQ